MAPYLVTYLIFLICFFAGAITDRLRLFAIIAFIPMFYLISARGVVGVDSAFYIRLFDNIRYQGPLAGGFEPGFSFLIASLTKIFPDSFDILIILGCFTSIIMLIAAFVLERKPILFLTIVVPFFMFDMTMNGLRYGLAFSIVAVGATGLIYQKRWIFLVCTILAVSIQVSSILVAVGAWALIESKIKTFIVIAIFAVLTTFFFRDYLGDKASANSDLAAPGGTAGLVPYIITILIIVAVCLDKRIFQNMRIPLLGIAAMQTAAFAMARYYYAGLRMEGVILFMLYIVLTVRFARLDYLPKYRPIITLFFTAAVMSSALRLKNFSDEQSQGDSPFAPYYFAEEVVA